jgi:hypothetical protein
MNTDKVHFLPASAYLTADQAIDSLQHRKGDLTDILMVGYDTDGELFVRSSHMSRAEAMWLLEKAKDWTLNG